MKFSIQLGFASLIRTFYLSPHKNISTIALITSHYLYTGHDLETSVHVDGYEGAGEFSRRLTYSDKDNQVIPLDSLISLVNASSHCEQYARWACKKSLIHNVNDSFVTFFGNRNFEMMNYFPGADPGSNMCACGKKGLCATSRVMCNCDANDDVWREDSGVFQSLDDLPIASVNAGDTGLYFISFILLEGYANLF